MAIFLLTVSRACTPKCWRFACLREAASAKAGHAGVTDIRDRRKGRITNTHHGHGHESKKGVMHVIRGWGERNQSMIVLIFHSTFYWR